MQFKIMAPVISRQRIIFLKLCIEEFFSLEREENYFSVRNKIPCFVEKLQNIYNHYNDEA